MRCERSERAGRPYRVVASSTSLEAIDEPAGRAITVTHGRRLPPDLRDVRDDEGLPELPHDIVIVIKSRTAAQPHTDALTEIILKTFSFD